MQARPVEARFWEKIDRSGDSDACWVWIAGTFWDGYGCFNWCGKTVHSHRKVWELLCGPIPIGLEVLHNCPTGDNPRCCNPKHLWLGTQHDNVLDMCAKGRRGKIVPPPLVHHYGRLNPASKIARHLSKADALAIQAKHGVPGTTFVALAKEYRTGCSVVKDIVRG